MYGFTSTLTGIALDQALTRIIAAPEVAGFGVLSDIDVQRAMEDELGVDMPPYRILGACNSKLPHRARQAVPDVGLLLPCNAFVCEAAPQRIGVGALDPQILGGLIGNPELQAVAEVAERLLRSACARFSANAAPVRAV